MNKICNCSCYFETCAVSVYCYPSTGIYFFKTNIIYTLWNTTYIYIYAWLHLTPVNSSWAFYQICKIAGCACVGNVFTATAGEQSRHVPWCMPGSLTSGFLWSWWRGKRARYSRHMRNPQFYVSGKRPMHTDATWPHGYWVESSSKYNDLYSKICISKCRLFY